MIAMPRGVLIWALVPALALSAGCANMTTRSGGEATDALSQGRQAWQAGDYRAALAPLRAAAGAGEVRALYALGYMYFYGRGVEQDRSRGIELIRRAAKAGDTLAVEALGLIADARGISRQAHERELEPAGRAAGAAAAPGAAEALAGGASGPWADTPEAAAPASPQPGGATGTSAAAVGGEPIPEATAADGRWLRSRDPAHFTIELLAVRNQATVDRYRKLYLSRSPPPEPVRVLPAQRRGRRWLVLVMGDYPDEASARRAIEALPPLLKAGKPEPLRFASLVAAESRTTLGAR